MNKMRINFFVMMLLVALSMFAADSLYVCRGGVYENILLQAGMEVNLQEWGDADSIVFTRPKPVVKVDFSQMVAEKAVRRLFIKANGEQKLSTVSAMKNYTQGSSTISDVLVVDVPEGATEVEQVLNITSDLTKGITITLQLFDNTFVSMSDDSKLALRNQNFVRRYTMDATTALRQQNWMATLPSRMKLNMVTMPGTHDAATSKCISQSKCQSLTIQEQLAAGVRVFDLRPRYTASKESDIQLDNLEIYHSITATGVKWKDAMDALIAFLDANPTETVIVKMHKEKATGTDYSATWRTSIRTYLQQHKAKLVQQLTTSTTLSDCRGKVLVLSQTPYGTENVYYDIVYGALIGAWEDDATFNTQINYTNQLKVCDLGITDKYNETNNTNKQAAIKSLLDAANTDKTTKWFMTWTNVAWKLFGKNPSEYAKAHNEYVSGLISSGAYNSRLGIIVSDFSGDEAYGGKTLIGNIVTHNYKYIYGY